MDYQTTVDAVMSLLKEKKVCSSSRRSHKDCYDSLEEFLNQTGQEYSEKAREEWLSFIKSEYPSQRYAVWKHISFNWKKWQKPARYLTGIYISTVHIIKNCRTH